MRIKRCVAIVLLILSLLTVVFSFTDQALICGTWNTEYTDRNPWTNEVYHYNLTLKFGLLGKLERTLSNNGESETRVDKYKIKNNEIILEQESGINKGYFNIIGNTLEADGEKFTRTSVFNLPVLLRIIAGALLVLTLILFFQKEKDNKEETISVFDEGVVMDKSIEDIAEIEKVEEKSAIEITEEEVEPEKILTSRLKSTMRTHSADDVAESDRFTPAGDL